MFGTSWTVSSLLFQEDPLRSWPEDYLLHTILESVDGGEMYVRMFFFYFPKGFDLVDHNVLLRELDLRCGPTFSEVDCCLSYEQKPEGEGGGGSVPTHMVEWRNSSRN